MKSWFNNWLLDGRWSGRGWPTGLLTATRKVLNCCWCVLGIDQIGFIILTTRAWVRRSCILDGSWEIALIWSIDLLVRSCGVVLSLRVSVVKLGDVQGHRPLSLTVRRWWKLLAFRYNASTLPSLVYWCSAFVTPCIHRWEAHVF